jgi:hypothetical protein
MWQKNYCALIRKQNNIVSNIANAIQNHNTKEYANHHASYYLTVTLSSDDV